MSTTFTDPTVEVKRNGRGQYLIQPPEGGKAKAYTRATTYIGAVKDMNGLIGWEKRMVAQGLVARPDLFARIAAAGNDKQAIGKLCDEAKEAAAASASANTGTALHAFTEAHDRGQPIPVPAPYDADVAAYVACLSEHRVGIVPGMIEGLIVHDDLAVAGMFDRVVTLPGYRLPLIADLKTGQNLDYSWGDIALQLALYASAPFLYDPATDTRSPKPEVDQSTALVIHLPAGSAACTLHLLDLTGAHRMLEVCGEVRAWRSGSKRLATPFAAPAATIPATVPTEQTTTAMASDSAPSPVLAPLPNPERPSGPVEEAKVNERVEHLYGRLVALGEVNPEAVAEIVRRWPTATPKLSEHRAGTAVLLPWQLDQIEAVVRNVEGSVEAPFYAERDPSTEGLSIDDPAVQGVIARVKALPDDLRSQVQVAARDAGVPKLSERPTARQLDQLCELVTSAEASVADRARLASTSVAWIVEQTGAPVAAALAAAGCSATSLTDARWTAREVEALSDIGDAIGLGFLAPSADEVTIEVHPDALDLLTERFGGKRPLLSAAREAAKSLGIDAPSKAADVVLSIPLVARLALVEVDDATPTPTKGNA